MSSDPVGSTGMQIGKFILGNRRIHIFGSITVLYSNIFEATRMLVLMLKNCTLFYIPQIIFQASSVCVLNQILQQVCEV